MHMRLTVKSASVLLLFLLTLSLSAAGAETPRAKPGEAQGRQPAASSEAVGISAQRLQRIHELMQRHIDAGDFSGAVTLVARNGRVAHLEAQGLMDVETRKPMQKDAIFQIMSMTKPIVGTSIMMMVEEGKA